MANDLNPKRRRGVILTEIGREKLRIARELWERQYRDGNRLTSEELSDISQLSPNTLTKIFVHNSTVDRSSLGRCFSTFGAVLSAADWEYQSAAVTLETPSRLVGKPLDPNITALMKGDLDRFVATETSLFDEIRQLVERQLDRTSERELIAMYCLAIRQADATRSIETYREMAEIA